MNTNPDKDFRLKTDLFDIDYSELELRILSAMQKQQDEIQAGRAQPFKINSTFRSRGTYTGRLPRPPEMQEPPRKKL